MSDQPGADLSHHPSRDKVAGGAKGQIERGDTVGFLDPLLSKAALRYVGLDAEKDIAILQLGAGPEVAAALETGKIAAAALSIRYAIPFLQRGWPMLVDLTKTDLVYPSSCVTSSRAYVKSEPKTAEDFLSSYVGAMQLIEKDQNFAERSLAKWTRERDSMTVPRKADNSQK